MKNKKLSNIQITRHTKIVAFSVICLLIITISYSYSAYFSIKTNSSDQSVSTGTLDVQITNSKITLDSMEPMSTDYAAMDKTGNIQSSSGYIYNAGSLDANYYITISYDYDAYTDYGHSNTAFLENVFPVEFISGGVKICSTSSDCGTNSMGWSGTAFNLGDLAISKATAGSLVENSLGYYIIWRGSIAAGEKVYFSIPLWLTEEVNNQEYLSELPIYLKLDVYSTVKDSESTAKISGIYTDDDGNPVANKTIYLTNGSYTATTDSDGKFTFSNLPAGIYDVKVGTALWNTTLGVFKLQEGNRSYGTSGYTYSKISSTSTTTSFLVHRAYKGTTTINGFKKANLIETDSITEIDTVTAYQIEGSTILTYNPDSPTINLNKFQGSSEYSLTIY